MEKSIELDCDPWSARPNTLLPDVIKGTPLEGKDPDDTVSRLFGNWKWNFDVPDDVWIATKPTLKYRIEALYKEGKIRYGSW